MEFLRFAIIHIVVPAIGLSIYLRLRSRMRKENVVEPPDVALFIIFATYGGWLVMVLTALLWYASGMASLGAAYLMLIAPVVMIALAIKLYPKRKLSPYHRRSFLACAGYVLIPIAVIVLRSIVLHSLPPS